MDPMLLEDPDARPKRLVLLAASGIAVATVFATTAAMVASSQRTDEALPDFTLKPTATSRPADTSFAPPLLPPPPPISSSETSETTKSTTRTTTSSDTSSLPPSSELPPTTTTTTPRPTPTTPRPTPTTPQPTPTTTTPTTTTDDSSHTVDLPGSGHEDETSGTNP